MCDCPVHIKNKSLRFKDGVSPYYFDVPCGHCKSCENRKIDDWFVRASAEFKRCIDKGGFVFFPTLTYNDDSLPRWYDKEFNINVPVFEKEHFKAFRNKLRIYLKREGYDLTGENTMRYFYVCEYGGERGRSHLHCLLFVPLDIDRSLFKKLVRKSWIYGFVRYSPVGDCVNSVKGVKYVMKYLSKDSRWFDEYRINEYIDYLKGESLSKDLNKQFLYHARLKEFRRHLPHHCQSMGFGSTFDVDDDMFINDEIPSNKVYLFDGRFVYHVPAYYKRKFLYDYDKFNGVFTINDRGIKIAQKRFNKLITSLERYYDSALSVSRLNLMRDFLLSKVGEDVDLLPNYDMFNWMINNFTTYDISCFVLAFRYRGIGKNLFDSFNDSTFEDISLYVRQNAYFYYMSNIDNRFDLFNDDLVSYDGLGFNDVKFLNYIHYGLCYYESVLKMYNKFVQRAYRLDQDIQRMQKGREFYFLNVI